MEYTPLNYNGFEKYLIKQDTHPYWGGFQYEFQFENGFGASVVKHDESFGNVDDLFELAILDTNGKIIYDSFLKNGVKGWLTNKNVINYLNKIKNL